MLDIVQTCGSWVLGIGIIATFAKERYQFNKQSDIMLTKITELEDSLTSLRKEQCRDYLLTFMREYENGEIKDEVAIEHAFAKFDLYHEKLEGNSYTARKWYKMFGEKKYEDFIRERK